MSNEGEERVLPIFEECKDEEKLDDSKEDLAAKIRCNLSMMTHEIEKLEQRVSNMNGSYYLCSGVRDSIEDLRERIREARSDLYNLTEFCRNCSPK